MTRRGVVAAAVAMLVVAGCGGPDPQALIDGAADALAEAGTSSYEMEVAAAGQGTVFAAQGAQDLGTGALRMAIDLGNEATSTETLLLGTDVFVRSPLFELFTGDAATWVQVDLEAAAADEGLATDGLLEGNTGPAALLGQLQGASDEVERLGREEVRGVDTTHLRVRIDTDLAIEQAPASQRAALRAYAAQTGLPQAYPMELWIDDDGLVRRIRTVLDVADDPAAGPDGPGATQETVLELFDFGVSVDLDAPAADQTVQLADLIAELEALEATEPTAADDG